MKISLFATHPVQYHVPWFRLLANQPGIEFKVYYASMPDAEAQGAGFDVAFEWDIPMLDGYQWEVLENRKENPRIDGFLSSNVKNVGNILRSEKPDVVILTGWQSLPLLQVLFWCIWLGIPRVVRGESNGLKPRSWKVKMVHRLLLHWYDAFLTIGNANSRFYGNYGINKEILFPCRYFVENQRLLDQASTVKDERENLRRKWDIPEDATCFLYAGKLNKKKRILDQLSALQQVKQQDENIYLLVVGTGELMDEAKKRVDDEQLPVTFAGFLNQTEITRAYVAADCLVLSSDYDETWGLVVNEAMVCGLPAIVSDRAGSGQDLIKEGETGYLYPFADIEMLANRMLQMAGDKNKLLKMGKQARELILSEYTVENAVEGTMQAVKAVLKN